MKNKLILIICLLTIPISQGFTQTSFRKMSMGKKSIGIGYQRYIPPKRTTTPFRFHAQTILGNLDYGFSRDLKISLLPGISFFDTNTQNPYEIAPSPSIDLRLLNVNDMNMTGLEFFILGGFRTQYMNVVRTGNLPLHSVYMTLRGGAGFVHTLDASHEWSLKPFFGLFYTYAWNNVSTTEKTHLNTSQNFITGEAGVEIDLSSTTSAMGSIEFSFDRSELLYRFGINFYQAPALNRSSQVLSQRNRIEASEPEIVSRPSRIDYDPHIEVAGAQYKSKVDPEYPESAKAVEKSGDVVLETTINEEGIPVDIIARTQLGFGLEEAAIEALKKTTFYPAIWRGEPISTRVSITYTFRIQNIRL